MSDTVFVIVKTTMGVSSARKVPNAQVGASEVTRVTKRLFESQELEAIKSFDGETRRHLDGLSLPFDTGSRMVPVAMLERVSDYLRERREDRQPLIDAFCNAYSRLLSEAQARLSSVEIAGRTHNLWNPTDYPDVDKARSGFTMSYQFVSFDAPDVLQSIGAHVFEEQRQALAQTIEDAKTNAAVLLAEEGLELVRHLREKLEPTAEGKRQRLHETTVIALTEFSSNLAGRAAACPNAAALGTLAEEIRGLMTGTSTLQLREGSNYHRDAIHQELASIEERITASLIPVARRRIHAQVQASEVPQEVAA
jgi:hypothetical protein